MKPKSGNTKLEKKKNVNLTRRQTIFFKRVGSCFKDIVTEQKGHLKNNFRILAPRLPTLPLPCFLPDWGFKTQKKYVSIYFNVAFDFGYWNCSDYSQTFAWALICFICYFLKYLFLSIIGLRSGKKNRTKELSEFQCSR